MSREKVAEALTSDLQTLGQISETTGISKYGLKKFLAKLIELKQAQKVVTSQGQVFYRKA
jgi:hypothetical protein